MKINCPHCGQPVLSEHINVFADLGMCPSCNEAFDVSETVDLDGASAEILGDPPNGAWYRGDRDEFTIGASTRSPIAIILVPFMCVWSLGTIGISYGTQIIDGQFNPVLSIVGIPFVLIGAYFWALVLMKVFGKSEVQVTDGVATVFSGIGSVGWRRRIDWDSISSIREQPSRYDWGRCYWLHIVLEGATRIRFGVLLSDRRRYFILRGLQFLRRAATER